MITEFTHEGVKYKVEHLAAMPQLHVLRRLGPVLAQALVTRQFTLAAVEAISRLPDADVEYVVNACLSTVQRYDQRTATWAQVQVAGQMMFQDLDTLPNMMGLVSQSMKAQFTSFLNAVAPQASPETGTAASGQPSPGARTG